MGTYIALDVGGSSIKTAVVESGGYFRSDIVRFQAHSQETATVIIDNFISVIRKTSELAIDNGLSINGIGIGFPGPFDYKNGISLMQNLNKYESIYQLPLKQELYKYIPSDIEIRFENDATLYCMGECRFGVGKFYNRIMCICIGTGIGSGFFADRQLIKTGTDIPQNGWIYNTPYKDSIADYYVSATGIRAMMKKNPLLQDIADVKELSQAAYSGNLQAQSLFHEFGEMLAEVTMPYLKKFEADCLIVGGDVSKSFDLFSKPLESTLSKIHVSVLPSLNFSDNTLLATSLLFE